MRPLLPHDVLQHMAQRERLAWKTLAAGNFVAFGQLAHDWTLLNRQLPHPLPSPFLTLVQLAKRRGG